MSNHLNIHASIIIPKVLANSGFYLAVSIHHATVAPRVERDSGVVDSAKGHTNTVVGADVQLCFQMLCCHVERL